MCGGAKTVKTRAINATHRPCEAKQGAMNPVGDNDTSSQPPNDLGGEPAMHDSRGRHRHGGAMMR